MASAVFVAALFAPAVSPVSAQDEISRPLGTMEQFSFTGGSGVTATWGGVQVGPYRGILESDPTNPQLTLYCIDFAHGISSSYGTIDVWATGIGNPTGNLGYTRLGAYNDFASSLTRYRKAAFLSAQFSAYDVPGVTETERRAAWSGLHAAIWYVMTPGFSLLAEASPFLDDLADAMSGVGGDTRWTDFNFDEWSVLTDKNANGEYGGVQEYLVRTTVTPEPETYVLLLSGMLGVFVVARRRLRELGYV